MSGRSTENTKSGEEKEDRQRGEMKKHLACFCDLVIMDNKSIMW